MMMCRMFMWGWVGNHVEFATPAVDTDMQQCAGYFIR
jgi:hypothetical protein